ncbi:MAG: TIGR02587 family membrane protein [Gemmatimonadetes bacterium]|nr:TIGR02587 family membrane protein [Gemmatimonadota bacterium]
MTVSRTDRKFFAGLGRAFGAAIFFSLPLLMTMEMWWLGFYMDRVRLVILMTLMIPMLIGLDHYSGFKETATWGDDVIDGMVAYGVGFVSAAFVLLVFNVIDLAMPFVEIIGKVSLQAVPASFGAALASSQLGGDGEETVEAKRQRLPGYAKEIFFMSVGALFLAFNVAPTEEMILIAFVMTPWHGLALAAASLVLMHAFVYAVEFKGQPTPATGIGMMSIFFRYTVVGYTVALLISAYVLWTFGRFEDAPVSMIVMKAVVLGFPAGLGAAAARLILQSDDS